MPSLKEVKERINSVKSTQQITKAMKMVAAAKLRKAQDRITQMKPYVENLSDVMHKVSDGLQDSINNKFGVERETSRVIILVITSDRGLCGAFNNNVCKAALTYIQEHYSELSEKRKVSIWAVGKKGADFFKRRNFEVKTDYVDFFHDLSFEYSRQITNLLMQRFLTENHDKVHVFYNEFKNVVTQVVRNHVLLPIKPEEEKKNLSSKTPEKELMNTDFIFEPRAKDIYEDLIPKIIHIKLYSALLDSNASEHGARMTAMDNATENAGEILKQLNLSYNRSRQAAITKEILEIVGGADALAK